jgi:hypothetical protein
MSITKEAHLKTRIMRAVVVCRIIILTIPIPLYFLSGLLLHEFGALWCLIFPMTALYLTLFFKYISEQYQRPGKDINPEYVSLNYYLILLLNLFEITLILTRSLFSVPPWEWFIGMIAAAETLLGIFAGAYLSEMFL